MTGFSRFTFARASILAPSADEFRGGHGLAAARCLSAAFSSREWAHTPMPVGNTSDPHSARGIIAGLGDRIAGIMVRNDQTIEQNEILGCVVGGVMSGQLVHDYGLAEFGAEEGDALLAYIGVAPVAQGARALPLGPNTLAIRDGSEPAPGSEQSLASFLFRRWLDLAAVRDCPRTFVRTRSVLRPILHMTEENGFEYRGRFQLDFRGEQQDRMIFARRNGV